MEQQAYRDKERYASLTVVEPRRVSEMRTRQLKMEKEMCNTLISGECPSPKRGDLLMVSEMCNAAITRWENGYVQYSDSLGARNSVCNARHRFT